MNNESMWSDIPLCSNYQTTIDGQIRNKKTGRILKACDNSSGYPTVNLYSNGDRISTSVHRIVAETFIGPGRDSAEINHRNGNKHCNTPNNLEWTTRGENERHAYKTGLKDGPKAKPVRIKETDEVYPSIKSCARAINGDERHITKCLRGEQRTHLGLTFEYADKNSVNCRNSHAEKASMIANRKPYKTRVRIVETGEVFDSIRECARSINGDQPTITACLKGRHKTHHGYHYEYV